MRKIFGWNSDKSLVYKARTFRNEWKYYLSLWDCQVLRERFQAVMQRDPYAKGGVYILRSLYFDDYWDSSYQDWIFLCGSTAVPEEQIPPIQRQETAVPEQRYRT